MKKVASLFLAITLLLCLVLPAYAAEPLPNGAIRVVVNEKELAATGVVVDGRTLVPMRALAEAMGAEVEWRIADQTVIVKKPLYKTDEIGRIESFNRSVYFVIGRKSAMVSGEESQMDVAPQIIGGQTMLPAKYLAGYLEADVAWDDASRTVTITSGLSSTPQGAVWADENQAMAVDRAMSDYLKEVNKNAEAERQAQLEADRAAGIPSAYGYSIPDYIADNYTGTEGLYIQLYAREDAIPDVTFRVDVVDRSTKSIVKTQTFKESELQNAGSFSWLQFPLEYLDEDAYIYKFSIVTS